MQRQREKEAELCILAAAESLPQAGALRQSQASLSRTKHLGPGAALLQLLLLPSLFMHPGP
jgi:hypothetical protein